MEAVDELLDAAVQAVDAVNRVRAGGVRLVPAHVEVPERPPVRIRLVGRHDRAAGDLARQEPAGLLLAHVAAPGHLEEHVARIVYPRQDADPLPPVLRPGAVAGPPGYPARGVLPVALEALGQVALVELHAVAGGAAERGHALGDALEHAVAHEEGRLQAHAAALGALAQRQRVHVALCEAHPRRAVELRRREDAVRARGERARAPAAKVALLSSRVHPALHDVVRPATRAGDVAGGLVAALRDRQGEELLVYQALQGEEGLRPLFPRHLRQELPGQCRQYVFHADLLLLTRPFSQFQFRNRVPHDVHERIHSGLTSPKRVNITHKTDTFMSEAG